MAFTLSQSGMVIHWLRRRNQRGWQGRLLANGLGAGATGIVMLVIMIAKFDRGAWVVVILIPLLVVGFLAIRSYYRQPRKVQLDVEAAITPATADIVYVPIFSHHEVSTAPATPASGEEFSASRRTSWPQVLAMELGYAARIAPDIRIIKVVNDPQEANHFTTSWTAYLQASTLPFRNRIHLEALISPYRTIVLPLTHFLLWREQHDFAGKRVAVLLPHEVNRAWWEWPLKRWVALRVRQRLRRMQGPLLVIDLPYTEGAQPA